MVIVSGQGEPKINIDNLHSWSPVRIGTLQSVSRCQVSTPGVPKLTGPKLIPVGCVRTNEISPDFMCQRRCFFGFGSWTGSIKPCNKKQCIVVNIRYLPKLPYHLFISDMFHSTGLLFLPHGSVENGCISKVTQTFPFQTI